MVASLLSQCHVLYAGQPFVRLPTASAMMQLCQWSEVKGGVI